MEMAGDETARINPMVARAAFRVTVTASASLV